MMEKETETRPEEIQMEKGIETQVTDSEAPPPSTPDQDDSEHKVGHQSDDNVHVNISWRTWVVVFISCFA
jgi:hypothetical protein